MTKYHYSETLGLIEVDTDVDKSQLPYSMDGLILSTTTTGAMINHYKDKRSKLLDSRRKHADHITIIDEELEIINESLDDYKEKYPENFI